MVGRHWRWQSKTYVMQAFLSQGVPMNSSFSLSDFLDWQLVKMPAKLSFKFKDSLRG